MSDTTKIHGWTSWTERPPEEMFVKVYQIGWDTPMVINVATMHPTTNVAGLYWQSCVPANEAPQ